MFINDAKISTSTLTSNFFLPTHPSVIFLGDIKVACLWHYSNLSMFQSVINSIPGRPRDSFLLPLIFFSVIKKPGWKNLKSRWKELSVNEKAQLQHTKSKGTNFIKKCTRKKLGFEEIENMHLHAQERVRAGGRIGKLARRTWQIF